MRNVVMCFIFFCLLTEIPSVCAQDDTYDAGLSIRQATAALQALDASAFDQVWQSTTPIFKALHDENAWKHGQEALRLAYGVNLERTFKRIDFRTTYFHEPDGNFAIVQFNSVFVNKAVCTETIILKKPSSSEWQIVDVVYN